MALIVSTVLLSRAYTTFCDVGQQQRIYLDAWSAKLAGNVTALDAMEIVAKTAGNLVIEEAIMYTRQKVSEGKNIAQPLTETNVFPPMVVQMVGVGEQTGALDAMLNKIADFYEEEVDVAVAALTSMIEPVMMVVQALGWSIRKAGGWLHRQGSELETWAHARRPKEPTT